MSNHKNQDIARQPAGSPDGGKFASKPGGDEADSTLLRPLGGSVPLHTLTHRKDGSAVLEHTEPTVAALSHMTFSPADQVSMRESLKAALEESQAGERWDEWEAEVTVGGVGAHIERNDNNGASTLTVFTTTSEGDDDFIRFEYSEPTGADRAAAVLLEGLNQVATTEVAAS